MSSRSITRIKGLVDDRTNLTLLNERPDLGAERLRYGGLELYRPGSQGRTRDGESAAQHKPCIESALHPALHGNDEQPPIFSEALHLTRHIVTGDHVQHHIRATPIVCVGETLQEREAGQTESVVKRQLAAVIHVNGHCISEIVVAYEPVWAIGTGRTASPEQAQQVHAVLRAQLMAATSHADRVRLLYGGSMNAANAAELLAQPDIDGGLVGGASLKAEDFLKIIAAAQ